MDKCSRERLRRWSLLSVAILCVLGIGVSPSIADAPLRTYVSPDGWSFAYPAAWTVTGDDFVRDPNSHATLVFRMQELRPGSLEDWTDGELERKLRAPEADNRLEDKPEFSKRNGLMLVTYSIVSQNGDRGDAHLRTAGFSDGTYLYELRGESISKEVFAEIVSSFSLSPGPGKQGTL